MLVILAAVNTTFIAWGYRRRRQVRLVLERALGATTRQVTAGLAITALLAALPGAVIGIPLGIEIYHLLASGTRVTLSRTWQLVVVAAATLLAVATALTARPSRLSAQRPPDPRPNPLTPPDTRRTRSLAEIGTRRTVKILV